MTARPLHSILPKATSPGFASRCTTQSPFRGWSPWGWGATKEPWTSQLAHNHLKTGSKPQGDMEKLSRKIHLLGRSPHGGWTGQSFSFELLWILIANSSERLYGQWHFKPSFRDRAMCIQIIIFHSPWTLTEQGFVSGCQQKLEAGVMGWHIHHRDVKVCHCSVAIRANYKKTSTTRILKKTQTQLTRGSSGHTLCHCKNCQKFTHMMQRAADTTC